MSIQERVAPESGGHVGPAPAAARGPEPPQVSAVLALQRTAGNRAVQRLLGVARTPSQENVCDDPSYCTPYATAAQAATAESWLRMVALPTLEAKFGTEVHDLWESYLSRRPGDSLTPTVFETAGNPIEESFATSWATLDDVDAALDTVMARLSSFPGGTLRPHSPTIVALSNFLTASEMDNRQIDFSNPLSKAGNIAGGIGSSDAGPDYRKILWGNVTMTKTPLIGNSGYIDFELTTHYEVGDAIDFCPGQCGSPAEQQFTIPMSRLEASGDAYDVPYIVRFTPETRSNREFYSSFPI